MSIDGDGHSQMLSNYQSTLLDKVTMIKALSGLNLRNPRPSFLSDGLDNSLNDEDRGMYIVWEDYFNGISPAGATAVIENSLDQVFTCKITGACKGRMQTFWLKGSAAFPVTNPVIATAQ